MQYWSYGKTHSPRDETLRRRLLDSAASLIARDGAAFVSLRSIAATAGTSTTAVYSLFGGKAELLTAVLDDGFASFAASQQEAAAAGLEALGRAYRTWALEHPILYGLMFGGSWPARCRAGRLRGPLSHRSRRCSPRSPQRCPEQRMTRSPRWSALCGAKSTGWCHWSWPVHRRLAGPGMRPMMPPSGRLAARWDAREDQSSSSRRTTVSASSHRKSGPRDGRPVCSSA